MGIRNPWFWGIAIAGVLLDQLTKFWVVSTLELTIPPQTIPLWPGVFHFTFVTNSTLC